MSDPTPGTSAAPSVDCGPTTRFSNQSNPAPPPRSKPIKPDHTLLKPPITTSITGLKQAIFALENSTPEVRDFLLHECNLIYECKACMNLFRSLANFISHKRVFCRTRLSDRRHVPQFDGDFSSDNPSSVGTVIVATEEPVDTIVPNDFDLMDYCPSLELMKELGIIREIEQRPVVSNLKTQSKKTIENIARELKAKTDASFDAEYYKSKEVRLESMRYTARGVFQTQNNTMGEQYVDLERARNTKKCVVVDPFNRILVPGVPSPAFREKLYENAPPANDGRDTRFPCPKCSKSFGRLHTVVQHLTKVHKFSAETADRMRPCIRKRKFTLSRKPVTPILTQTIFDDIKSRRWSIRIPRLTDSKISRWTKTSFSSLDLFNSVKSSLVKVECPRLSNTDILKFSPKKKFDSRNTSGERIPIIPSIKAKVLLNGISGNDNDKKIPAEKNVITIDEDAEDEVVPDGSDVSMSGSDPQPESDEKDNVTESVTTVVEDDEVTLNLKIDPESQESFPDSVVDNRKKDSNSTAESNTLLTPSPTTSDTSASSSQSEMSKDDTVTSDETSAEVTSLMTSSVPKSRRKLLRSQITKVVPKIELNGADSNDISDSKVDEGKECVIEEEEIVKKNENVEENENVGETEVKTAETQSDEVKTSADSDSKPNADPEIPSRPQEPEPQPDPPAAKNGRGEKRKRFQSDLSSSGSGVSSSSRDPSPNRKVSVTDSGETKKSSSENDNQNSGRTETHRRFRSIK